MVLNVTYIPLCIGKNFLVIIRDEFNGWLKAKAIRDTKLGTIAKFIYEEGIYYNRVFRAIVIDGGLENQLKAAKIVKWFGAKKINISAYYPKVNGVVKVGHKVIKDALSKIIGGGQ